MNILNLKIAVIGLGYVGLPLAVELGKKYSVVGFDINPERVLQLLNGRDVTNEMTSEEIADSENLTFSDSIGSIGGCNCYIVTVPTPIDNMKKPDLAPLFGATEMVGAVLREGDIVIYESTVYPGMTEEECAPLLEKVSGLKFNQHFFCGYSPERINPGDKNHRLRNIKKVTSGSNPEIAKVIDELYGSIIDAGTHLAPSIKVAEAAKVIENTQRDVNISLINELALIFNRLNIDTEEVLSAAGSKWNFLPFRPGLVGGHCIGVDPYYLTHKAQMIGYTPEVILAGRKINDNMGNYVAQKLVQAMAEKEIASKGAKVLILGFSFKENCPDIRNTRVIDIYDELIASGCEVDLYDPLASADDIALQYNISALDKLEPKEYSAVVLAVAHEEFSAMGAANIRSLCSKDGILYDLKYLLKKHESDLRL